MKDIGVSQADVAREFQVAPPTVSGAWLKHGRIGKHHYPKLVTYFRKPYSWWFDDEPATTNSAAQDRNDIAHTPPSTASGPTIAYLCGARRLTVGSLAPLLGVPVAEAARIVSGEVMPTPDQKRLLGAIFNMNPELIGNPETVTARPVPGNARKRNVSLDGYEYQLIQQYRHLPEAAQHVLRAHAVLLEETFGPRSTGTPYSRIVPPSPTESPPTPSTDSNYGSW